MSILKYLLMYAFLEFARKHKSIDFREVVRQLYGQFCQLNQNRSNSPLALGESTSRFSSIYLEALKYLVGVQQRQFSSWREGASLALVGHPSSDGVTIKMPYGVDVLHRPASHPIFSYWVG